MPRPVRSILVHLAVVLAGVAALSWELVWQIEASLALGVSALGTALTLAATMGGMTGGALLAARLLRDRPIRRPLRLYAILEGSIGLAGLLLLGPGFRLLESLDAAAWATAPPLASLVHLLGITLLLAPPTFAMGATIPIFGLIARRLGSSISLLYGLNAAGAALGVLGLAFVVLPVTGVSSTIQLVAGLNLVAALITFLLDDDGEAAQEAPREPLPLPVPAAWAPALAFATGFATFALEVAWFRSLRAAFRSTTDSFAIILASVLIPLALAATLVRWLQKRGVHLGWVLALAGVAILGATPIVERFDLLIPGRGGYWMVLAKWFGMTLLTIGPGVLLLATALPWLLESADGPRSWGRLYALNTVGAIVGSLLAAWALLPTLGFARTAWLVGAGVVCLSLGVLPRRRLLAGALGAVALIGAVGLESGVGRERVNGTLSTRDYAVLEFDEGPDSTVSVIENRDGNRILIIDGFEMASDRAAAHYMYWMGHLPMLTHPDPKDALVICFGTGQTSNAVRHEGPDKLQIVDLNESVFDMAPLFRTNQGVLEDPVVEPITMDGRAWMRRTDQMYDVITLEPMPPNFAGVNALYSQEFYEAARERLRDGGTIAQWLPFHLVPPEHAVAIAATFQAVFPDAALWMDPPSLTGILIGRKSETVTGFDAWPGFAREVPSRDLDLAATAGAVVLDPAGLELYASWGEVITDDNQLLAYGGRPLRQKYPDVTKTNRALVAKAALESR